MGAEDAVSAKGTAAGAEVDLPLRGIVDSLSRAVIVTDTELRIVLWNHPAELLYGWQESEVLGRTTVDVLRPFGPAPDTAELFERILAGEPYTGDRTLVRRDGEHVRVLVTTRVIRDDQGTVRWIVSASEDVGSLRVLEREAQDLTERLTLALDAARLGTWRWDIARGEVSWDVRMEELFGFETGTFDGTFDAYAAALHPEDREHVLATVQQALVDRAGYHVEHRVASHTGETRWLHGAGQIIVDEHGEPTGAIGCSMDVTDQIERRLAGEAAAAAASALAERERIHRERIEFIVALNDSLANAQTVEEVVEQVVRSAVPRLGDWCSVYVVSGPGDPAPRIVTYHVDPEMVTWAQSLVERFPYDPEARSGMAHVIRTGEVEFFPEINHDVIEGVFAGSGYDDETVTELRSVLDRLRLRSAITVPLVKRGRVLGGILFATTTDGRSYTTDDLDLARAVAGRVAASIENRRLSDHQRHIAKTLQESLLPESLPAVEGLDVAVRYWAAGEGIEVGGDFYDLFEVAPSQWAAIIGDVCGTGPAAAAITGLARHSIRQAAWHGDDAPTIFEWLNKALIAAVPAPRSFLTAAHVDIAPADIGFDLEITVAGHPLPVLVPRGGAARNVGVPGVLLGILDAVSATPTSVRLEPGDALILFTDGVTDVPPPHDLVPEETVALLGAAVAGAGSADEMAEAIRGAIDDRLPIDRRPDDIALVVIRASA